MGRIDFPVSEMFWNLLAATGTGYVVLDERGRVVEANSEYLRLTGRSVMGEIVGRSVVEWTAPHDRARNTRAVRACLKAGLIKGLELDYLRPDGSPQPVEISAMVMPAKKGNRILSLCRDLSDRKRNERRMAQLNRLKERLLLPEPLQEKLGVISLALVDIFSSDFARIWIVKPGDLCHAGCFHAQASDTRHVCQYHERCLHLMASAGRYTHLDGTMHRRVPFGAYKIGRIAAGDDLKFITNNAGRDPRVHDHAWARSLGLVAFAGYRLLSAAGTPMGVLALFSQRRIVPEEDALLLNVANTTAQVLQTALVEEALRAKTEELDRYFMTSLDLLCIADMSGHFLRLNPEWSRTLGYPLAELEGRRFVDLVHPDDMADTLSALADLAQGRQMLNFVNRFRCQDGSYRWIEWRSYASGRLINAVARDITERQRAQQERLEMERQVQQAQKLESLGVLAGGIAHDFNNLLSGILGSAELALLAIGPGHPAQANLALLKEAALRATELCRQMLAYSGKGKFVIEALDLSVMIAEMRHLLEVSISKKAALRLELAPSLPAIDADVTQIRQILLNLVINASEAMEDRGGVIRVATGALQYDRDYLNSLALDEGLPEGYYVFMEVGDTGCGMDDETMKRIFDPFFTTKFSGRGLGLAATLGIVRGHHGAIKVYSEVGVGTNVKILLPASSSTPVRRVDAVDEAEGLGGGVVLVIDDEVLVRDVCQQMLEHLGFRVLIADEGTQGLELFRKHAAEIVVVILDMTMPKLSGEEVYREIRCLDPAARVVLMSGYNEQETTDRFAGKGLAGFLQKPFQFTALREKLRAVIGTPSRA
jgi:PAS domain S-box-containing protein